MQCTGSLFSCSLAAPFAVTFVTSALWMTLLLWRDRKQQGLNQKLGVQLAELRRENAEHQGRETTLHGLLESISDGFVAFDHDWRYVHVNSAAAKLSRKTREELLGKVVWDVFPQTQRLRFGSEYRRAVAENISIQFEDFYPEPLNSWFEVRCHPSDGGLNVFFVDITERKKTERWLRQLSLAVEQSPSSVVITDTKGDIEYVNPKFTEITGYSFDEAIGANPRILKSGEYPPETYKELWETIKAGGEWRGEFHNRKKNGELYWEAASICPITDENGTIRHFLAIKEDITKRREAEKAMVEAKQIAEEANRLKSEFLANMSHEIRTPMNGVIGLTGLLLDTPLNSQQRDYARMISGSADALLTIINDILDFSKIEARKLTLETLDCDVLSVIEGAVELGAEQAHSKGIELAEYVDPAVPSLLRGDPGRLRQVLTNLLSNAIKFTERGEVVLTVSKLSETSTDALLRFEIRDTGIGMTREVQSRLFQAFSQADGSTTRKYGGTGLGLAISKQLVAMMNGEIGVISQPGSGSTFWFTVRLEKRIAAPEADRAAGFTQPDLAGIRVLIVDDNATNRSILHRCLSFRNMEVASAASGNEALEILEGAEPDSPVQLAILDMAMPEMDGLTLAAAIKASHRGAHIRVVILTSLGETLSGEGGRNVDACLVKPVKQSSLYDCLARVMANHPVETAVVPESVHPFQAPEACQDVRILLAEDNPVNRVVAVAHLKQLGYKADVASTGLEVLHLLRQTPYDIILMDCQMPDMDGYETTRRIRGERNNPCRPYIIALTAHATHVASEKCFEAGMNDYISKPVRFAVFAEVLGKAISVLA